MKKSVVLTIAVLFAAILVLQHIQRKSSPPAGTSRGDESFPGGVPLPAEATAYAAPPMSPTPMPTPSNFTPPSSMAGKGPIPIITADFARQPVCAAGKSLNDILSSHGKVWGNMTFGAGTFSMEENKALYEPLARYFSCLAAAYGNLDICNYLPGVVNPLDKYYGTPHYKCLDPVTKVLFFAYAAGKYDSDQPCRKFFEGDNVTGAEVPPEFCREAAKGFAHVCNHPNAGIRKSKCRATFPSKESDCKTPVCLESFSLYSAIKDGKAAGCPGKYQNECGAFFAGSPAACSSLLTKAGEVYCKAFAAHEQERKKSLPEETRKKREAERLAAEQKKEEQRLLDEVNSKARKLLGKEKGKGAGYDK